MDLNEAELTNQKTNPNNTSITKHSLVNKLNTSFFFAVQVHQLEL